MVHKFKIKSAHKDNNAESKLPVLEKVAHVFTINVTKDRNRMMISFFYKYITVYNNSWLQLLTHSSITITSTSI